MTNFSTHSLDTSPYGETIQKILAASLSSVEPGEAVRRALQRQGHLLTAAGQVYDLRRYRRVFVVGGGKAGAPMAWAVREVLGPYLGQGLVVVKEGYANDKPGQSNLELDNSLTPPGKFPESLEILEASHPLPDERGVQASQRLLALLASAGPQDLVLCLISGGGSALLTAPAPGLTLADFQILTSTLLACGASINELNTLRKHLDLVKGGGLAQVAAPATLLTLVLSDVIGDPLDVIASGPTVPDPTTFAEAWAVIERYQIQDRIPKAILAHLERGVRGDVAESPKPDDPAFANNRTVIIGSNLQAAQAALQEAQLEGLQALLLTTYLQGEAAQAGRMLAAIARQLAATGQPLPRPACIIAGGETIVNLGYNSPGLGGRNQELALAAILELSGLKNVVLATLATDGGDGPTDAAGAVVSGDTFERAHRLGLDPRDYLARHDAYHFFEALGDLIRTGPTQTNVNDLAFLFAF